MTMTYKYGEVCCSCSGCHEGTECEFAHEGGLGQRGGRAWSAVQAFASNEEELNTMANEWLNGGEVVVNATPHTINIICDNVECHHGRITDEQGMDEFCSVCRTIPKSPVVARVATVTEKKQDVDSIPVFSTQFGQVEDLPEKEDRVFIIVSRLVRMACPDRADLLCPGPLVRNDKGQPVGCKGLSR